MKTVIPSNTTWEPIVGYSRAVRVGNRVEVSGTTAVDRQGTVIGEGDAYQQAVFIFKKIAAALHQAGAAMEDVVRTRMYVTDIRIWEEVGRAHGEAFGEIRPASTLLAVSALVDPRLLVEIEASAVIE